MFILWVEILEIAPLPVLVHYLLCSIGKLVEYIILGDGVDLGLGGATNVCDVMVLRGLVVDMATAS